MSRNYRLIAVVWDDAHRTPGEVEAHEIDHKPYRFTSVGILVRSDDDGVSVAGEVGQGGAFRDVDFIPRKMIVEEYSLGELKRRPARPRKSKPPLQEFQGQG